MTELTPLQRAEGLAALSTELRIASNNLQAAAFELASRIGGLEVASAELAGSLKEAAVTRGTVWGWDSPLAEVGNTLRILGVPRYTREFETWLDSGRRAEAFWASKPLIHYSDKGADGAATHAKRTEWAKAQVDPFIYTWYHEPMGNVEPAVYRATAGKALRLIKDGLRADLLVGNGPILTRYWVDKGGDPDVWWYDGADMYFVDCYLGSWKATRTAPYPPAEWMFASTAAYASKRGVRWGVPELGGERNPEFDPTGELRAAWLLDLADWLELAGCNYVGWWQRGGTAVTADSPEARALRTILSTHL